MRPCFSGRSTRIWRSKRPGLRRGRVEDLRPIGRRQQDDAGARIETIQLDQQLVQGLFLLVMAAGHRSCAAGAAHGIQLVDEDDAGRHCLGLIEQIAHARRPDADEHLDEFRAADREEGDPRLAGNGAREQRLAGAGRADQKHAPRQPCAEFRIALRIFEEIDDLLDLDLGLLDTRDVGHGGLGILLDIDLGLALADRHQPAAETAHGHAAHQEEPDADEDQGGQHPGKERGKPVLVGAAAILDTILLELFGKARLQAGGDETGRLAFLRVPDLADDSTLGDHQLVEAAVLQILLKLAIGERYGLRRLLENSLQDQPAEHSSNDIPKIER